MTIPAVSGPGGLSSTPVPGDIAPPENRVFYALTSYELGPLAIEDTTEGNTYQNWTLTYNTGTGLMTATPETIGFPVPTLTVPGIIYLTFTFDQNGRISYTWMTETSSYLYWYDTALGMTVTTDLGSDVITPSIALDDKRVSQNSANDMLLWYSKPDGGGAYNLYMLRQRDRFLTEYLMESGISTPYITKLGMNDGLRVQFTVSDIFSGGTI